MGFDPAGAPAIVDEFGEDEEEDLQEFLLDLEDKSKRNRITEMIRIANASRVARTWKSAEFDRWVRLQMRDIEPRKKKTFFERLGAVKEEAPKTFFQKLRGE